MMDPLSTGLKGHFFRWVLLTHYTIIHVDTSIFSSKCKCQNHFLQIDDSVPKLLSAMLQISHGPDSSKFSDVDKRIESDRAGLEICKKTIPIQYMLWQLLIFFGIKNFLFI